MPKRRRLIIVANRLPVHRVGKGRDARWESSAGGLVTALAPVLEGSEGSWVGWTGAPGPAPRPFVHDDIRIRAVPLSTAEIRAYYHGFSNRTLWPLYHDAIRAPDFTRSWWEPYQAVNRRFARAVAQRARRGDIVWIHDYHLQLVPAMLRVARPDLRIGFFLHIPFPPLELFAWLPWRGDVIAGLLGADLVGFQTPEAAQNFVEAARDYASATGSDTALRFMGRTVRVGSFPISIDTGWYESVATRGRTLARADEIRRRMGPDRRIMLAVDRLDYTKGIDYRLLAFEELLRRGVINARNCVLMQIAAPSRESVSEYAQMRSVVEGIVGRINGEFALPGFVPVQYFRRNLSREELVAYYRAAEVMLVTPLRDGMNLVCKEYVASRVDGDGVLVLSEFAGAVRELRRALIVNPRDVMGTMSAIARALNLERREARLRMSSLRSVVREHDVHHWAGGFVEALGA